MFAMQYDIHLPRDYDMSVIRDRVATRGHALDDLPGLGLKAYLVRDTAVGAPLNSYSPFYLWTDEAAAARFLWGGGGFSHIVRDFTRPPVRTWIGGGFAAGTTSAPPTHAVVRTVALPEDASLQDEVDDAARRTARAVEAPNVHSAAHVVDPSSWELTTVILSRTPAAVDADPGVRTQTFEVLHLSAPGVAALR